jgi:hypothetical protein
MPTDLLTTSVNQENQRTDWLMSLQNFLLHCQELAQNHVTHYIASNKYLEGSKFFDLISAR